MLILYKIFINIMAIMIFTFMAHELYSFQREIKVLVKFIVFTSLGTNLLYFADKYIGMGMRALLILPFMTAMSCYLLKLNLLQSLAANIINAIALAVGDISAVLILVKVYKYSHEMIKSNILLSLTADLIIYGTVIIIIFLIRLFRQVQEVTDKYKRSLSVRTLIYMFATFLVIAVNYSVYIKFIGLLDQSTMLINVVIMWLYLILSLYINFMNSALALKEQQYDQQQDYIKTIDSLVNDFRRLKHNYSNTIYSIFGYIEENDMEGLRSYYMDVMDEVKRMDRNVLLALQRIKVYAIFGLLWNKINEAESKGIEVGVQVINEIYEIGMKLTDLCEVLGNYLDNAIDAAGTAETKKISLSLIDDEGFLTIKIENTYYGPLEINKINQERYSTKGGNRGFGLAITDRILSKYVNVLHNTSAEDGIFKQELVIKK